MYDIIRGGGRKLYNFKSNFGRACDVAGVFTRVNKVSIHAQILNLELKRACQSTKYDCADLKSLGLSLTSTSSAKFGSHPCLSLQGIEGVDES